MLSTEIFILIPVEIRKAVTSYLELKINLYFNFSDIEQFFLFFKYFILAFAN